MLLKIHFALQLGNFGVAVASICETAPISAVFFRRLSLSDAKLADIQQGNNFGLLFKTGSWVGLAWLQLSHFGPEMGQFGTCETMCAMSSTAARATMPSTENGTVHFMGTLANATHNVWKGDFALWPSRWKPYGNDDH
jgi:hypothetical protein